MDCTNTNTNTQGKSMTAKAFKQKSYDAYIAYVSFIEGALGIVETVDALKDIMEAHGYNLTVDNIANTLTVKMTAFGKDKGEQAKKVKSISTFRSFIKGGWADVEAAPVHSNAGKNPCDAKTSTSSKKGGMSKAELAAKVEELTALLAAKTSDELPSLDDILSESLDDIDEVAVA